MTEQKRPIKRATPQAVRAAVKNMQEGHIHCRTLGHVWVHRTVTRERGGTFVQTLGCKNCATEKVQWISRKGNLLEQKIYYGSDGYLLRGLGLVVGEAKDVIRLASVLAQLKGQEAEPDHEHEHEHELEPQVSPHENTVTQIRRRQNTQA